jgi:uncharacterized protein
MTLIVRVSFFVILVALLLLTIACGKTSPRFDTSAHRQQIEKWQETRLTNLKKEDSWLSLVGLYWLNEGENKIGSDATNPVVMPKDRAPAYAGSFWLENGQVRLAARPGVEFTSGGQPVNALALKADSDDGGPTILKLGSLLFNVVKRGDRIGVRVKDTESQTRKDFQGLEYFPIDPKWRVEARLEPYQPPKTIPITNVLGMTDDETSPGALVFEVDGKSYRIDPILEKGETDLFVMIADGTTGRESYGAGRYLYVSPPDASGKVVIDFNKTYNPPCAFTNYATCPLPPRQNHLPLRIEAGEKKYTGTLH